MKVYQNQEMSANTLEYVINFYKRIHPSATLQNIVDAKKMLISQEPSSTPSTATDVRPDKTASGSAAFEKSLNSSTFNCMVCNKEFQNERRLEQHQNLHNQRAGKPYACTKCGKFFSTPGYLETHMRLHTGVKPYTCPICGRQFAQRPGYTYHMRTHTGDKRYKCKICDKQFIQIGTIKRHCETHDIPSEGIDSIIIRINHISKPIPKPVEKRTKVSARLPNTKALPAKAKFDFEMSDVSGHAHAYLSSASSQLSPKTTIHQPFGSPSSHMSIQSHSMASSGSSSPVASAAAAAASAIAIRSPLVSAPMSTASVVQHHLKFGQPIGLSQPIRIPTVFPRFSALHPGAAFFPPPRMTTSLIQPPTMLFQNQAHFLAAQYQRNLCHLMNLKQ